MIDSRGARLHSTVQGPQGGPWLVLTHALGTDLRIWDAVLPHLPPSLRILRLDMRGHGRSPLPDAPCTMGALIGDAAAVCGAWQVRDAVIVGHSVGGMIAQGLAVKRPDLIRGLVLSNTAARIGTPAIWQDRADSVRAGGMAALAEPTLERWFPRALRDGPGVALAREMLLATPPEGYAGACSAISGSDFFTTTASLRLPTLAIAGSEDGSTPPDLVQETADLIPGSRLTLMRRAGHLPMLDRPGDYAAILTGFLKEIGHV